jgi:UDP-N-acetylmuramoyl-tripeptide--D-alanyl-D-alanine ligase
VKCDMIYLNDLLQATGGVLAGGAVATEFTGFAFDSRQLEPGQLFLAVKTASGDGHDYIADAVRRGATGVLCESGETFNKLANSATIVVMPDVQQTLIDYAAYILKKYRPTVVAVTGSSGKTTTKEAIAAILQKRYRVFKNFGSYNGRYGLPIALGQIWPDHEMAVLEIAGSGFGEIAALARITQPHVGVITNIHQTYLSRLGTLENIAAEKGHLIEVLPFTGSAILNADDPRVAGMAPRTQARILTFGLKAGTDVCASEVKLRPDGLAFSLQYEGKSYQGRANLLGRHQIYSIMAAITTGLAFDIPPEEAVEAIAYLPRLPGRLNRLTGQNGALLLDDTFNASPEATLAALDTLAEMPGVTKVAILGDIPNLGDIECEAHRQVGRYAAARVQRLVTKGEAAQETALAALESGMGKHAVCVTFTTDDAVATVQDLLSPDTVILVKGGVEARMERVVQKLLAQPHHDQQQLVRQEAGWTHLRARPPARPTWVEIDLEAIANNVRLLVEMAAPAKILAVLKADAYGHGMIKVA